MNDSKVEGWIAVAIATILDLLQDESDGLSSGYLYAGFSAFGMSLESYEALLVGMTNAELIIVENDVVRRTHES